MRNKKMRSLLEKPLFIAFCLSLCGLVTLPAHAKETFTPDHVAKVRSVGSAKISPDGEHVAYVLTVPRRPHKDDNGPAWAELHVVDMNGQSRPFVTGEVNVSSVHWTPDGSGISFLAKRNDDEHKGLYLIPINGGEARKIVDHETDISSYDWSPDGQRVAFLAKEKKDKDLKKLEDKGFDAEIYEEDWRHVKVWTVVADDEEAEPEAMDLPGTASVVLWNPSGGQFAVALAPTPLVDDSYMARRIHIVETETGDIVTRIDNPGKLGAMKWSPDGKTLAVISAEDLNDSSAGRLMVRTARDTKLRDLVPNYQGQFESIAWRDNNTIMYLSSEGCHTTFGRVDADGSNRDTIVSADEGPVLHGLSLSKDGQTAAYTGESPTHPNEVFVMKHGESKPRRLTDSNPWLAEMRFAKQEVVQYYARDELMVEGILVRPLDEKPGQRYPLILTVHGGPESHIPNGWVTRYSRPGQVGAAAGYAVFYPNYRGSTGRGVAYSKLGQSDYGGKEFDDLVDAIGHLVKIGLVDRTKVGVTGGSYGGFASAWCATKLTEHFAASVMFVGISDQISKSGTTDIPVEMYEVHSRRWPWEHWDWFRERSPLYYVEQARTPILILHGKDDPRVHPSQSMELHRYLKLIGKTPVRMVLYPGEGHGNRKAAARLDYNIRMMRWMDHYLKGPAGDPPPYEIDYGFEDEDDEDDDDSDD